MKFTSYAKRFKGSLHVGENLGPIHDGQTKLAQQPSVQGAQGIHGPTRQLPPALGGKVGPKASASYTPKQLAAYYGFPTNATGRCSNRNYLESISH